jgi:hypothetical protein
MLRGDFAARAKVMRRTNGQELKMPVPMSPPKLSSTAVRLIQLIARDLARKDTAVAKVRRSK